MKFIACVALLAASGSLVGCGSDSAGESGEPGAPSAAHEAGASPPSAVAEEPSEVAPAGAQAQGASVASPASAPPAASQAQSGDHPVIAAEPPTAFLQCRSCHSVEPGKNGIGPSLAGVFGRPAASVDGFNYSPALQSSGIVWTRDTLDEWLRGPMQMVPGTRMVLPVRSDEQRQAIIDYMESLK